MAPAALHPSNDVLAAFGHGTLDEPAADEVARHLDSCPACQRRVAELPADPFLGRLRDAVGPQADTSRPEESAVSGPPARGAPATLPPELVAGAEYTDVRELGRGGMGTVYLARNTILDRLEVLKVVTRSADRFAREVQAAAKLKHPNVVGAYSARRYGGLLVFAMEYVPGEDLARLVKTRGPLPVADACQYAYQAALGLQHAHEQGMVHRDIKPHNLILTRDGGRPVVKILDFGLAKATSETPVDTGLTAEGAMLGTPDYMAPEQSLDAARADIRSDIYSLGCTLYHLLAGRPPFGGRSLYEVLGAHHAVEAPRLSARRREVPDELAAVVAKMMAKDPARRYQTPAAVAAALVPFFEPGAKPARPSEAAPPPLPRSEPPPVPKPLPGPAQPPRLRRTAPRPGRQRWRGRAAGAAVGLCLLAVAIAWATGALRVKTPDGTIVLDGLPADAEVLVDDKVVTVTRNGDQATITLARGGPYGLKVRVGDRELKTSDAEVRIGGEPVRVWVEGRPPEAVPIPPAADPGLAKAAGGPPTDAAAKGPKPAPDLFAAGTVWRGNKRFERGWYAPLTAFYELRVDKRDGENFSGVSFDNGPNRNASTVTGTVRGDAVSWTEVSQHDAKYKNQMRGTRTGTVIPLTFKGNFTEGSATLYRVPKRGEPKPNDFVPIFDGRSLAGWETHPDQPGAWAMNQYGKLVGMGPAISHLYTKRDDYGDVHVKARAMVNDGGNSGVFVRAGFGPAPGRKSPDGYEAQIYAGPDAMKTGGLYLPLASKSDSPLKPSRPAPAAGQWFDLDIIAIGPTVRVLVNGQETARAENQTARPGGRIALQLHDPKRSVEFASIAVKELSPAAVPTDPEARRPHDVQGRWRIDGDELVQEATDDYASLSFGDVSWSDYDLTCDVKRTGAGHEVHLRYRVSPSGQETFGLGGWDNTEDFAASWTRGKAAHQRKKPTAGTESDRWYTMQVRVRGTRCECLRDGQLLFQYDDPKNTKGAPGVGTYKTAARFRNIRATDANGKALWEGLPDLSQVGKAAPIDPKVRAAVTNRGDWTIDGNELVQGTDRLGDCQLAFGDPDWTDYDFVCEGKSLGGNGEIGQTVRVNEAGRYEWVRGRWTGADWDSAGSVTAGNLERLRWRRSSKLEPDKWYKLEVRVRGSAVECCVDGESVFRFEHDLHKAGRVGLRTYRTPARFRNLRVTDPSGKVLFEGLPELPATAVDWLHDS